MRHTRRRGQIEWEQTVGLIVIAAAALVLAVWWYNSSSAVDSTKQIDACRLSVLGYAKGFIDTPSPGSDLHITDVDCERRVVTFTKSKAELNGKKLAYYDPDEQKRRESYGTLTPNIVNSVVASEMATCWYEFLEGKSYWTNEIDWSDNYRACFVCGEIRFASDAPTFNAQPLYTFLRNNQSRPYPTAIPKTSLTGSTASPTYFEYLYTTEHICNHNTNKVLPDTWYQAYIKAHPGASCEEAFFNFLTAEKTWEKGKAAEKAPILDDTLAITPGKSYLILFFQYGVDKDKNEGHPTGASYAPVIIPASDFNAKLCERYIG